MRGIGVQGSTPVYFGLVMIRRIKLLQNKIIKKNINLRLLFFLSLCIAQNSNGQSIFGSAGASAILEPRCIVDMPTAGMMKSGSIAFDAEFYQQNGALFSVCAGAFSRLTLGISFGGTDIVGYNSPHFNPTPGFLVKVRLFDESIGFPACAAGFDTQGREPYIDSTSRYTIKSPGLFLVFSKNYSLLGNLGAHVGANYTLERADGNRDVNIYVGADKSIGSFVSFALEYNIGLNDRGFRSLGEGRGYLNALFSFSVGEGFTFGLAMKNLVKNQNSITIGNRVFRFEFVRTL